MNSWSYLNLAAYIASSYNSSSPPCRAAAADLMEILAAPMLTFYHLSTRRQWKGGNL